MTTNNERNANAVDENENGKIFPINLSEKRHSLESRNDFPIVVYEAIMHFLSALIENRALILSVAGKRYDRQIVKRLISSACQKKNQSTALHEHSFQIVSSIGNQNDFHFYFHDFSLSLFASSFVSLCL